MRFLVFFLLLTACAGPHSSSERSQQGSAQATEVSMFALGLLDTGYQFGGSNPEAGLDCSGMVRYVFKNALGVDLPHNAAAIAKLARPVDKNALQAGDLVFFNTQGFSFSHVGIFIGDNRFIHAPASKGKVRIDSLAQTYYASRFQGGRTLYR